MSDRKKILIVDDDRELVLGLGLTLQAAGYDVVSANDGMSATATARRENPDLILLDLGLPAGDGYVVLERLQNLAQLSHIPVLVISARDPITDRDRSLEAGAQKFFQKPVEKSVLLQAIEGALKAPANG